MVVILMTSMDLLSTSQVFKESRESRESRERGEIGRGEVLIFYCRLYGG